MKEEIRKKIEKDKKKENKAKSQKYLERVVDTLGEEKMVRLMSLM